MRDAMRDIINPPDHLTVTQTERMVIMTTGDGRTTRLSTDGKTIKDESTNIERKTKWDGGKLVSEISHLGPGKITETYWTDPAHRQLRVTVQVENARQPMTVNRVYDALHDFLDFENAKRLIVYGIILIVMMILRPDGLLTRDSLRRFSLARLRRRHA